MALLIHLTWRSSYFAAILSRLRALKFRAAEVCSISRKLSLHEVGFLRESIRRRLPPTDSCDLLCRISASCASLEVYYCLLPSLFQWTVSLPNLAFPSWGYDLRQSLGLPPLRVSESREIFLGRDIRLRPFAQAFTPFSKAVLFRLMRTGNPT